MFAAIRRISIHVHSNSMSTQVYGSGTDFHLLWCHINDPEGVPNHYDLLEKSAAETPLRQDFRYITYRRRPSETRNGTIVLTINLSGSLSNFEKSLKFKADILLIQEHWRGPDDINSWQSKARHAGWH